MGVVGTPAPGRRNRPRRSGAPSRWAIRAQRMTARATLFSAVVLVEDPDPVRAMLAETYPLLGLDWIRRPSAVFRQPPRTDHDGRLKPVVGAHDFLNAEIRYAVRDESAS